MSEESMAEAFVLVLAGEGEGAVLEANWRAALALTRSEKVFVLCSAEREAVVLEFTPGLLSENVVLQPDDRGTAPALALAMVHMGLAGATTHDPVLVLRGELPPPAPDEFRDAMGRAIEACVQHASLVVLAVSPGGPMAPFAWLGLGPTETTEPRGAGDERPVRRVLQVKLDAGMAEAHQYRESGNWRWASGALAFRHGYMGYIMGEVCEELDVAMLLAGCLQQADTEALAAEYALMPSLSFEEAVLCGAPSVLSVDVRED
jgi:mannose-1-phosphate guanylyltransferase